MDTYVFEIKNLSNELIFKGERKFEKNPSTYELNSFARWILTTIAKDYSEPLKVNYYSYTSSPNK